MTQPNEGNVQIFYNRVDSLPLYIDVLIEGFSDQVFDGLVDNGACVNLIKASVVDSLEGIKKYPSSIKTISGIGQTAIQIEHFVKLKLRFKSNFITTDEEFYVVPSQFLKESLILGVPLLKTNKLLPDMATYQLLLRKGSGFVLVAADPTKVNTSVEPRTSENIELGAHQCGFVPINICNCSYSL